MRSECRAGPSLVVTTGIWKVEVAGRRRGEPLLSYVDFLPAIVQRLRPFEDAELPSLVGKECRDEDCRHGDAHQRRDHGLISREEIFDATM